MSEQLELFSERNLSVIQPRNIEQAYLDIAHLLELSPSTKEWKKELLHFLNFAATEKVSELFTQMRKNPVLQLSTMDLKVVLQKHKDLFIPCFSLSSDPDLFSLASSVISHGDSDILGFLVESGLNPKTNNGFLFNKSIQEGSISCAQFLLDKGCNINSNNALALTTASQANRPDMFDWLIQKGISLKNLEYSQEFFMSVEASRLDMVKYYLDKFPDKINHGIVMHSLLYYYKNEDKNFKPEVVECLLRHVKKIKNPVNGVDIKYIFQAEESSGEIELVKMLEKNNVDIYTGYPWIASEYPNQGPVMSYMIEKLTHDYPEHAKKFSGAYAHSEIKTMLKTVSWHYDLNQTLLQKKETCQNKIKL